LPITPLGHGARSINADGTGFRQLTNVEGEALHPDWSPDGRQIVFELDHPSGPAGCSVVLMDADGTNMVDLTGELNGCEGQPSFTPGGRRIVFGRLNAVTNVEAIWSMNLHGGDRHRITTGIGKGVTDPNVSPLGHKLSFVAYNGTEFGQALYRVRLDGSHLPRIVPFRFDVGLKHDWAPDGHRIAITPWADYPDDRSPHVATIRPDGSHRRLLSRAQGSGIGAFTGSYSPNGRWIVFRHENLNTERFGLYKIRPDGSDRTLIAPMPFAPRGIDWGPQPQP
jgi:Tol biopolymer transport system component